MSLSATTQPMQRTAKPSLNGLIILLLAAVCTIILFYWLPYAHQTNMGLCIFFFIAILWLTEAIHITFTALLIPILATSTGLLSTHAAFVPFANPVIFLFFGGFALASALKAQSIDQLFANRILMLAQGKLLWTSLALFSFTALVSMWISNTATTAMMLPLVMGVLNKMDLAQEKNTAIFILLGIAYSASIGGLGTLVGSPPNAIAAAQLGVTFWGWMKIGTPIMAILLPCAIAVLFYVFKPNLTYTFTLEHTPIAWTKPRVCTLVIFAITVFSWIFSIPLSHALGGIQQFDTIIALSAVLLIGISGVSNWKNIQSNTEWGVLLLFGGGLALSTVLQQSGASAVIASNMADWLGHTHVFFIIFAVTLFIVFLTEFTSNVASAALLIPIFTSITQTLGMSNNALPFIISVGASCAFMLPVATAPNAIVFGTGLMKQADMIRAGLRLNVVCVIIISLFAWFFWQ